MAIPARLCETLKEYKAHQDRHASFLGKAWQNLGYVFTEEDGYVMNPQTPTKQFSKFLKRHGIRHRLCSEFSVNAYPHGKTVHILRSSEPEAEAEPPPLAARSVLDRLA